MPTHEGSYPPSQFKARSGSVEKSGRWRPGKIAFLRLAWILLIFHQEYWVFRSAIRACDFARWMDPALPADHKVAMIGDPQLVDENTYTRRGIALSLTKFYTDLYMRRNYRLLNKYLALDTIIFTGDLFDGGREWHDAVWAREYARFQTVFPTPSDRKVVTSLPGNHDIGISDGIKTPVYERFREHFGDTSVSFNAGSWDIIVLDTVSLSAEDPSINTHPRKFLESWKPTKVPSKPRLLVTHVPLFRAANAACGPLRESNKSIVPQKGYQYQNVLEPAISDEIWSTVHPSVIFAGDDHDYCDYKHDNGIHEFNVKSFSWAMGIQRPGFQLVTLSGTRYETYLCLLPGQLPLFARYGVLLVCMLLGLIVSHARTKGARDLLPRTNKDDAGKGYASRNRFVRLGRSVVRDAVSVGWVVLIFYTFMIWW